MATFNLSYLSKTLSPPEVTFEIKASKYEFSQETVQSIVSTDKVFCIMSLNWYLFSSLLDWGYVF